MSLLQPTAGCALSRGGTQGVVATVAHLVLEAMLQDGAVVARVFQWIPNQRDPLGANRVLCEVWVPVAKDGGKVCYCSAAELLLAYGMATLVPQSTLATAALIGSYEAAHVESVAAASECMATLNALTKLPDASWTPSAQAGAWYQECLRRASKLKEFLQGEWLPTSADVRECDEQEGAATGRGTLCVLTDAGRWENCPNPPPTASLLATLD